MTITIKHPERVRQQLGASMPQSLVQVHLHIVFSTKQRRPYLKDRNLRELKRSSSLWIKTQSEELSSFQWQNGYGAFSVSPSHAEQVKAYIVNQETYHHKESFQDEFRRLCKKYGVEIDERYVWD